MTSTHIYFCSNQDCKMEVSNYGTECCDCSELSECPGCGEDILVGANGYCADCWGSRFDSSELSHWCGKEDCDECQSEYYEQCGGCGTNCNLWNERYCKSCYDDRYVPKPPQCTKGCGAAAPGSKRCYVCIDGPEPIRSPAYAEPDYRTPDDVREIIKMITEKLRGTKMTPRQQADWQWLLGNREEELARMEAEMWAGYDKDDLRKLDLQLRRGGW
jgi:hypothetical protein